MPTTVSLPETFRPRPSPIAATGNWILETRQDGVREVWNVPASPVVLETGMAAARPRGARRLEHSGRARVENLERLSQRHADSAEYRRQALLGLFAQHRVERRPLGHGFH